MQYICTIKNYFCTRKQNSYFDTIRISTTIMAIKLIKACKELNISMRTVINFCAQMGTQLPTDPNTRITDEMYILLQQKYGRGELAALQGIKSIGVEDFRKFNKLDTIALNGVTYLVGGNNAGKSTVVKALRLIVENLKTLTSFGSGYSLNDMLPKFRMDIPGVNIGTFEKAINRKSKSKTITLQADLSDNIFVRMLVTPTIKDSATAAVSFMRVEDKTVQSAFEIDTIEGKMRLYNTGGIATTEEAEERLTNLKLEFDKTKNILDSIQSQLNNKQWVLPIEKRMELVNDSTRLNAEREKLETIIKSIKAEIKQRQQSAISPIGELLFETNLSLKNDNPEDNIVVRFLKGMQVQLSTQNTKSQSQKAKNPIYVQNITRMIGNYRWALAASAIEYIGAHAATQKTIFSLDDHNDATVAIIHEWKQQQINPGETEYNFITKWMQELKIGEDFSIDNHFGEAYSVNIYERKGEAPSSMSELGMGAIQMMTLLLHISSLMRKYKQTQYKPLIAFEEPEQNMHPNWQSHLADIFEEVRQKGFRILVETHSEYMIRKSQVQVAQMQFVNQDDVNENCPISTYYFPTDEKPYKMEYRPTGGFVQPFGEGFFDEAAKWDIKIMQNELNTPIKRVR